MIRKIRVNDFYTLIINDEQTSFIFETFNEAIEYIKQDGSWDCRPDSGRMDEWYDPASGWI